MMRRLIGTVSIILLALAMGCGGASVKTFAKPLTGQRQYGKIKKVAVMPFDSVVEGAQAPRITSDLFLQELLSRGTFEQVEEPRYVAELMKKLKLRNTENLDREIVRKMGEELKAQALILGNVLMFAQEEKSEIVQFSVQVNMLDSETGEIVWSGNSMASSATTLAEVFGVSKGPSVREVAAKGVSRLARRMDREIRGAREDEVESLLETAKAQESRPAEPEKAVKQTAAQPAAPEKTGGKPAASEGKSEEILLQVKPK